MKFSNFYICDAEGKSNCVIINLSGRGDKDMSTILNYES